MPQVCTVLTVFFIARINLTNYFAFLQFFQFFLEYYRFRNTTQSRMLWYFWKDRNLYAQFEFVLKKYEWSTWCMVCVYLVHLPISFGGVDYRIANPDIAAILSIPAKAVTCKVQSWVVRAETNTRDTVWPNTTWVRASFALPIYPPPSKLLSWNSLLIIPT